MSRRRELETIKAAEYITIGELSRLSGVRYSTLKFYTEDGLITFVQSDCGLTRRYKRELALRQLEEICELRKAGMSIAAIKELKKNRQEEKE